MLSTENLLFSNRQERVKRFNERICKTQGSISGLLAAEAYHATDRFFGKAKLHVGQKTAVRNVQKPVHSHLKKTCTHRIGGNRERRFLNNFSFSIAKISVFDCQNRYNGNRKRLIRVHRLPFWQSKTLYLAIVSDFSENERSFAIAAYPVWCSNAL